MILLIINAPICSQGINESMWHRIQSALVCSLFSNSLRLYYRRIPRKRHFRVANKENYLILFEYPKIFGHNNLSFARMTTIIILAQYRRVLMLPADRTLFTHSSYESCWCRGFMSYTWLVPSKDWRRMKAITSSISDRLAFISRVFNHRPFFSSLIIIAWSTYSSHCWPAWMKQEEIIIKMMNETWYESVVLSSVWPKVNRIGMVRFDSRQKGQRLMLFSRSGGRGSDLDREWMEG